MSVRSVAARGGSPFKPEAHAVAGRFTAGGRSLRCPVSRDRRDPGHVAGGFRPRERDHALTVARHTFDRGDWRLRKGWGSGRGSSTRPGPGLLPEDGRPGADDRLRQRQDPARGADRRSRHRGKPQDVRAVRGGGDHPVSFARRVADQDGGPRSRGCGGGAHALQRAPSLRVAQGGARPRLGELGGVQAVGALTPPGHGVRSHPL